MPSASLLAPDSGRNDVEIALRGIGVSPGIAIGPALAFDVQSLDIPKYAITDTAAEIKRFDVAVEGAREELKHLHEETAQEIGERHAAIFKAHLMMLDDVTMRQEIRDRLKDEGLNVEYLLDDLVARYTRTLKTVDDSRFRERTADLVDVSTRILGKLLNTELKNVAHLRRPCIVVAHDLSPSETANIDIANALGLVTDLGGPTSHTAILARALEIPAVVGLKYAGVHVTPGDTLIVDGANGFVVIRPTEATLAEFTAEKHRVDEQRQTMLLAEKNRASITLDGAEVPLYSNIELPVEVSHSLKVGTQGVGLYRTEYLFLNRNSLPSEDEQFSAYSQVAAALNPMPVTLRTLDLGGDKFASHLQLADEINPQLGWRAIRFCLERPDVFKAQLRAMLRASIHGNVQIMFPLISGVEELRRVRQVYEEVRADLEARGVPFDKNVKIGTMIEVPSAVMVADHLAKECDFFSIGTNDLIQYSLAVDRVNEKIAHMYEPAHPAILRMILRTAEMAKQAGIPCSICGEMAGDPLFTEILLGLGIVSLSMSSVAIPSVRSEINNIRLPLARRFAKRVLAASTVTEVRDLLTERYKRRGASDMSHHVELGPYRSAEREK